MQLANRNAAVSLTDHLCQEVPDARQIGCCEGMIRVMVTPGTPLGGPLGAWPLEGGSREDAEAFYWAWLRHQVTLQGTPARRELERIVDLLVYGNRVELASDHLPLPGPAHVVKQAVVELLEAQGAR